MFDFITSLSVIEHGVNIQNYFKEMNRILKKDGILLTSTDYWPDKIVNGVKTKYNPKHNPDNIFSMEEIETSGLKMIRYCKLLHLISKSVLFSPHWI